MVKPQLAKLFTTLLPTILVIWALPSSQHNSSYDSNTIAFKQKIELTKLHSSQILNHGLNACKIWCFMMNATCLEDDYALEMLEHHSKPQLQKLFTLKLSTSLSKGSTPKAKWKYDLNLNLTSSPLIEQWTFIAWGI